MAQSTQSLMKEGIAAHAVGDRTKAALLFSQALRQGKNNDQAWLWLGMTLVNPGEQRYCYEQALVAKPETQAAKTKLAELPPDTPSVAPPILGGVTALPPVTMSRTTTVLMGVALTVFILLYVVFYKPSASPSATPRPLAHTASDAWYDCRAFVTKNLKAPSTAKFPVPNDPGVAVAVLKGKEHWGVLGYVDSQNSFGAMLRSSFTCEVTYSGDEVRLNALQIGDQTLK